MIVKQCNDEITYICEFDYTEFKNIKELANHIEKLIEIKSLELEELINDNCHYLRVNRYVSFQDFNFEVNTIIIELAKIVDELYELDECEISCADSL